MYRKRLARGRASSRIFFALAGLNLLVMALPLGVPIWISVIACLVSVAAAAASAAVAYGLQEVIANHESHMEAVEEVRRLEEIADLDRQRARQERRRGL